MSGVIQDVGTAESFLSAQWLNSDPIHADEYKCEAIAVGEDNLPLFLTATNQVNLAPSVFPEPEVIHLGLTRQLDLTCSMDDLSVVNMSSPMSLSLLRIHAETEQLLSTVTVSSPASLMPGVQAVAVHGQIG